MGEADQERVWEYVDYRKVVVSRRCASMYRSTVPRSSGSKKYRSNIFSSSKLSKLIVIFIQLVFLSSVCKAHLLDDLFGPHRWFSSPSLDAGRSERRSMLSYAANAQNYCSKFYSAAKSETCASLRQSSNLTQEQILEINPGLNCLKLQEGQSICVAGISASCGSSIAVTAGQKSPTCSNIDHSGNVTPEGFLVLNPGISCPEAPGNNNKWPKSQLVCSSPGLGNIFFEYIGGSGKPVSLTDVQPLVQKYPSVIYHFILAFAIDYDSAGNQTNGLFYPYWYSALSPNAVQTFKAANPGVQILMSLGGASKSVNANLTVPVVWTDPSNVEQWITNAQASIAKLVGEYSIDGIDIDYEAFPSGSSTFAFCIGTLIQRLKGNNTIGLATIAPYDLVVSEYRQLMSSYGDQVDYVNYQFYASSLNTVQSYVSQFHQTGSNEFVPWKLTASSEINGSKSITGSQFLQATEQLPKTGGLKGVMLYDADHSVALNFTDEKGILAFLSSSPASSPSPGSPGTPSPGSPGAPPSPGSPGTAPSPGSPGAPPSPGGPGTAPSPGSPRGPPSQGSPGVSPAPGSHGAAPSPGSPRGPPSQGSPGVSPAPGSHGAAPSPGSPRAPPSPGSPGVAPAPGSHGGAPSPGSHGGAPSPGSHGGSPSPRSGAPGPSPGGPGVSPAPGSHGVAPSPGSHGVAPSPGSHGVAPSPGSHGVSPSPGGPSTTPSPGGPASPPGSPGTSPPPGSGPPGTSPSPGSPGGNSPGGPQTPPFTPASTRSSAPTSLLLGSRWSTQGFSVFTATLFLLLFTFYAS